MSAPSPWERLRKARIVQVLVVYLGASWVVLQLAGSDVLIATPAVAQIPTAVRAVTALADQVPASTELLSGNARAAYDMWSRMERDGEVIDAFGSASAADAVGDHPFAERYYLAAEWRGGPVVVHRLAKMYEEIDRLDDPLEQYRRLERMWAEADDDFQPWVEVQEALERLGG